MDHQANLSGSLGEDVEFIGIRPSTIKVDWGTYARMHELAVHQGLPKPYVSSYLQKVIADHIAEIAGKPKPHHTNAGEPGEAAKPHGISRAKATVKPQPKPSATADRHGASAEKATIKPKQKKTTSAKKPKSAAKPKSASHSAKEIKVVGRRRTRRPQPGPPPVEHTS